MYDSPDKYDPIILVVHRDLLIVTYHCNHHLGCFLLSHTDTHSVYTYERLYGYLFIYWYVQGSFILHSLRCRKKREIFHTFFYIKNYRSFTFFFFNFVHASSYWRYEYFIVLDFFDGCCLNTYVQCVLYETRRRPIKNVCV